MSAANDNDLTPFQTAIHETVSSTVNSTLSTIRVWAELRRHNALIWKETAQSEQLAALEARENAFNEMIELVESLRIE